tara:strand:- start:1149 stop:1370 length:222 start_codon:yes stop_codon:yes gene_type:complete
MEVIYADILSPGKVPKKKISSRKKNIETIIREYRIKRSSFNPKKASPNIFVNKLEYRLKQYYDLYKFKKEITK